MLRRREASGRHPDENQKTKKIDGPTDSVSEGGRVRPHVPTATTTTTTTTTNDDENTASFRCARIGPATFDAVGNGIETHRGPCHSLCDTTADAVNQNNIIYPIDRPTEPSSVSSGGSAFIGRSAINTKERQRSYHEFQDE